MKYRIEWLPNGLIRLYNYECQWSLVFNGDGSYRHSGVNTTETQNAINEFIKT